MQTILSAKRLPTIYFALLMLCRDLSSSNGEHFVSLEMPRFASRGSTIRLTCNYNVQPNEVHKVEWHKGASKLAQYIRGRVPPFTTLHIPGAQLNMSLANERSIVLQNVDFETSGTYYCEVTFESPIFTQVSEDRDLLVIHPQSNKPTITFSAKIYTAGDILEATCKTSPAYPAPHITWMVNNKKVKENFTVTVKTHHHHSLRDPRDRRLESSITKLNLPVSSLKIQAGTPLQLTCISTIPAYRSPGGKYADIANHTVTVDVKNTDEPEMSTTVETITDHTMPSSTVCSKDNIYFLQIFLPDVFLLLFFRTYSISL